MTAFADKLKQLIKKAERLKEDVEVIAEIVIEEDFPFLVKGQLEDGENMNKKVIQPYYSVPYARRRSKKGLQTDYVDLFFTGDFYREMKVVDTGSEYVLVSDVPYFQDLYQRYEGILGLQNENMKLIKDKIIFEVVKEFKDGK